MGTVEDVMKALTVDGQKHFKEDLHAALERSNPGREFAYTVAAWVMTKFMVESGIAGKLRRLPEIYDKSESLTIEQFAKRIGL